MRISDLFNGKKPIFSFEFFPPKTPVGEQSLVKTLQSLKALDPAFVSVTCGAGGSKRGQTIEWAKKIRDTAGIEPLVHMTCLGVPEDELNNAIDRISEEKFDNVLALRGDRSPGVGITGPCEYANELVELIRKKNSNAFIAAACYPESHLESNSKIEDLENLKRKADAGVDLFITQLFFDNRHYFEFVGRARSMGITQPILPGIMPIQNVGQTKRFTEMCGATLPPSLLKLLEQYQNVPSAVFYIGVAHAIAQSAELLANGAPGVHFYTLNRSPGTRLVVEALRKEGF